MSYIDVTGKTEDEAIRKALAQLGMDRDDVSVEILERAKSGFLGMECGRYALCADGAGAAGADLCHQLLPAESEGMTWM